MSVIHNYLFVYACLIGDYRDYRDLFEHSDVHSGLENSYVVWLHNTNAESAPKGFLLNIVRTG